MTPDSFCSFPVTLMSRAPSTIGRKVSYIFGHTMVLAIGGLVLQRHEDDAGGGAGALAHQHEAPDAHRRPDAMAGS